MQLEKFILESIQKYQAQEALKQHETIARK